LRVLVFGEILWDCFGDRRELGGAPLNFAVHLARLGHAVRLISALGADEPGRAARERLRVVGLPDDLVGTSREFPTGRVTVELDAGGDPAFTIHRPAAYDAVALSEHQWRELRRWDPEWIYFGTLAATAGRPQRLLEELLGTFQGSRRFYDLNLRAGSYTPELLGRLLPRAQVAKLNEEEMRECAALFAIPSGNAFDFCEAACARFGWRAAAVTFGARGCGVWLSGDYAESEGFPVKVADTVGAGDAFSAAFLHGLAAGMSAAAIGVFANRVAALVATRHGGTPDWTLAEITEPEPRL